MNPPSGDPLPEQPRSEPEILPPVRGGQTPRIRVEGVEWTSMGGEGIHRVFIREVGPVKLFLWSLVGLAIVAGFLFLFASVLLVAIPVVIALAAGSLAATRIRRFFGR